MGALLTAFSLAFGQLADRRILAVLGKTVAVTLLVFAALAYAGWYGFAALLTRAGMAQNDGVSGLLAIVAGIGAAWLLFRFVALAVLQFFADEIVLAVEAKHYPEALQNARRVPLAEEVSNSLKAALRAVLVNLAALPFALVLLVTGIGAPLLFWAVNAVLLGRELQDMVWLRHLHQTGHGAGGTAPLPGPLRFMLGGMVAGLLLVPFVNFLAPVLGAAAATHLVHRKRKTPDAR